VERPERQRQQRHADQLGAAADPLAEETGGGSFPSAVELPSAETAWADWSFSQRLAMVAQLFFGSAQENATQRTVFADDGATAISVQSVADDGTTQTQGRVP
jgi:hypothetical protein